LVILYPGRGPGGDFTVIAAKRFKYIEPDSADRDRGVRVVICPLVGFCKVINRTEKGGDVLRLIWYFDLKTDAPRWINYRR
jgi:hypothetical protein